MSSQTFDSREANFLPCTDWSTLAVGAVVRFKQIEMCPLGNGVKLSDYCGQITRIYQTDLIFKIDQLNNEFSLVEVIDLEYRSITHLLE